MVPPPSPLASRWIVRIGVAALACALLLAGGLALPVGADAPDPDPAPDDPTETAVSWSELEDAVERLSTSDHPAAQAYRVVAPITLVAGIVVGLLVLWGTLRPAPVDPEHGPVDLRGLPYGGTEVFLVVGFYLVLGLLVSAALPRRAPGTAPGLVAVGAQIALHLGVAGFTLTLVGRAAGSVRPLGLLGTGAPRALGWGVLAYFISIPLVWPVGEGWTALLEWLGHWPPEVNPLIPVLLDAPSMGGVLLVLGMAGVVAPLSEEIVFRGILYPAIARWTGRAGGIACSAVLFAVVHPPVNWLPIVCLGVLLAWVYDRTGSLLAPIALHLLHNAGMLTVLCLLRGVA